MKHPSACEKWLRRLPSLGAIAAFVFIHTASVALQAAEPKVPKHVLFSPTFISLQGPLTAGTAFVCEAPGGGSHLLLTAHHLFGPGGGLEAEVPWNKLTNFIKRVIAVSTDDSSLKISSRNPLTIPGAKALDDSGVEHDIAAFELPPEKTRVALKLAKETPKIGDTVWLYAQTVKDTHPMLFSAKVVFADATQLDYALNGRPIIFTATSGAPVLNEQGEVVAINIGSRETAGKSVGVGNPASSVVKHLNGVAK